MVFNWKKTFIVIFDVVIAVYLLLAVSAFNTPAEKATVCTEVKIDINNESIGGFVNPTEIKNILEKNRLYPLAKNMADVNARAIEETLMKNPFVEKAECYKTQSGHVCISLRQRTPILHIMANNGESYYIDNLGAVIPSKNNSTDLVVATGDINRKYAQTALKQFGLFLLDDPFWHSQIEQINVLSDGSVEMVPRVGDHIVYLGQPTHLKEKLTRLEKFYRYGLSKAGWNKYSYINIEFNNQIICKRRRGI